MQALRLRQTSYRTLARTLEAAAGRANRIIGCHFPRPPGLPALGDVFGLIVKHPAGPDQLNNSTKELGVAAKVLGRLHSHASRSGASHPP